jgi:hypothetical protein
MTRDELREHVKQMGEAIRANQRECFPELFVRVVDDVTELPPLVERRWVAQHFKQPRRQAQWKEETNRGRRRK